MLKKFSKVIKGFIGGFDKIYCRYCKADITNFVNFFLGQGKMVCPFCGKEMPLPYYPPISTKFYGIFFIIFMVFILILSILMLFHSNLVRW